MGEDAQQVHISSYKINNSWGCKIQDEKKMSNWKKVLRETEHK